MTNRERRTCAVWGPVLCCCAVLAAGCKSSSPDKKPQGAAAPKSQTQPAEEARRVFADGKRFSLIPPEGWRNRGRMGEILIAFNYPADKYAGFHADLVQDNGILEAEVASFKKQMRRVFGEVDFVEEGTVSSAGYQATRLVWKDGSRQDLTYIFRAEDGRVYSLSFVCLSSDFAKYLPIFDHSAGTVRLTPPD